MRPGSALSGSARGDGRGAGLRGHRRSGRHPGSRLPQSPRPPAVRAPRCGPAPWPSSAGPAVGSGVYAAAPRAGMLRSQGLGPATLAVALTRCSSRERGKFLLFGTGLFPGRVNRWESAWAGARGAHVGSWAGTASCWCECGRNPLLIARRPHPRSPPMPCHCSLRALGPRQPERAQPTSPRPESPAVFPQSSSHLREHGSPFVCLSAFALAVPMAWSCLQVVA